MVGKLTFADDAMFVNGIPFVVSVSIGVNFTTVEYVIQRLNTILANYIRDSPAPAHRGRLTRCLWLHVCRCGADRTNRRTADLTAAA